MGSTARTLAVAIVVAALVPTAGWTEKLVDPDKVAPEFRDAAIKRRAEQIRIQECHHKADEARVLPRDRTAHVQHCLDEH